MSESTKWYWFQASKEYLQSSIESPQARANKYIFTLLDIVLHGPGFTNDREMVVLVRDNNLYCTVYFTVCDIWMTWVTSGRNHAANVVHSIIFRTYF
jgi:hypothetical protein